MMNEITLFTGKHYSPDCVCSFCLLKTELKQTLDLLNYKVYVEKLNTDWSFFYPSQIHFNMALMYHNKVFGDFYFESSQLPTKLIEFYYEHLDYIIAGSNYIKQSWINSGVDENKIIHCSPGLQINKNKKMKELYPDKFKFLIVGAWQHSQWQDRKGIEQVYKLFKKEFKNKKDVILIIKTDQNCPKDLESENIIIIRDKISFSDMSNLYYSCAKNGAFISAHKGEGFGRTILEALLHGCLVGTTNYSGVLDFVNSNNSYLFNYKLVDHLIYDKELYINKKHPQFALPEEKDIVNFMQKAYDKKIKANINILGLSKTFSNKKKVFYLLESMKNVMWNKVRRV